MELTKYSNFFGKIGEKLSLLFVVTMAVSFTNMFNGELVPFYIKYVMAIIWIGFWLYDIGIYRMRIERISKRVIRQYCMPYFVIAIWSLVIWCIDRPSGFSFANVSRMLSNTLYICLTYLAAVAGAHFFGRRAIRLSVCAMGLSTVVNLLYVISHRGVNLFVEYISTVFDAAEYAFESPMYNFSLALETQDIAMASGFYIIYYILFDKVDKKKNRYLYALICVLCAYIGFKRTTLLGIVVSVALIWLVNWKGINFKYVINTIGIGFIGVALIFIVMVKSDTFSTIIGLLGVDANGRITIYSMLAKYYELSPFYLGKGFLYVDKTMYDSIGFVAHSVIVKMYAEIGSIPFLIWMYHYLVKIPQIILNNDGLESSKVAFVTTLYLFTTFFMENTMSLFCIQYSYLLIPLAMNYPEDGIIKKRRIVLNK